jgi:hypothetical protein
VVRFGLRRISAYSQRSPYAEIHIPRSSSYLRHTFSFCYVGQLSIFYPSAKNQKAMYKVASTPNPALNLAPFGRWTALKRRRLPQTATA